MTLTTYRYKWLSITLSLLSFGLYAGPFIIYVLMGLFSDALVVEKVSLVSTIMIVGIMTVVAAANKIVLRSRLWILLIGLYCCLDNIMTPLIIVAVCQVIDELIVSPLAKHCKTKTSINAELDRRLGDATR